MNIAEQLKAIASELSYRGTRAGEIRLGTKDRAEPLRQELVRLYNMERKPADNGQVAETPRGVLLRSAITHLMAAVYGAGTHTPADHEAAIVRAAGELNMMAEQLQALDDQLQNSAEKQTIDQTISATEQTEVGQNSGTKKKPWNPLADDLKKRWFAEMRKRKQWIPRKQFITDFLESSDGMRGKWNGLKASTEDRRFQDNKGEWEADAEAIKSQFKNRR